MFPGSSPGEFLDMENYFDTFLILLMLVNVYTLGISRLFTLVKLIAFQSIILALLPFALPGYHITLRTIILCILIVGIKTIAIPFFAFHAMKRVQIRREIEPLIGFTPSLFVGIMIIVFAFALGKHLALPFQASSPLIVPTAIATLLTGLTILVSRRKAITQVLGYVLFESGIYIFSMALAESGSELVEMGVLLDLFVGVFIMGITLLQIKDVFDDLDVSKFVMLKD